MKRSAVLRDRRILAALLDAAGISERELARRANLGHATVNHLVTGRRSSCSLRTAQLMAAGLGCEPEMLFDGLDDELDTGLSPLAEASW